MHTPEQAKSLWCPMVRHNDSSGVFNRAIYDVNPVNANLQFKRVEVQTMDKYGCHCISNQCAMWRTGEFPKARSCQAKNAMALEEEDAGYPRPDYPAVFWAHDEADGGTACWTETHDSIEARRPGYCGLAGRPGGQS